METKTTIRARCPKCAWWDRDKGESHFTLVKMTEWRPPEGLDPLMRQFECPDCGCVFYKVMRRYE